MSEGLSWGEVRVAQEAKEAKKAPEAECPTSGASWKVSWGEMRVAKEEAECPTCRVSWKGKGAWRAARNHSQNFGHMILISGLTQEGLTIDGCGLFGSP